MGEDGVGEGTRAPTGEEVRPRGQASLVQMLVVGAIASVAGGALALAIDWFPAQGSTQAGPIDTLNDVLLLVSVPIFVLVMVVVLFSVWKFRERPGEELSDGPPIHGNTRLEVIWTAIPAIILVALCTYAYVVLSDIEQAQADEMRVNVIGQQFTWTFEYPQPGGEPIRSSQLYLPEGRPVHFTVRSLDVIHDFWVPAFRMKIDAVPGITTDLRVTPKGRGSYPVVCAELCGLGHAYMRQTANVVSARQFETWMQGQRDRAAGRPAADGEEPDGEAIFTEGTAQATACGACHTLADAGTSSATGPDLDEVVPGMDEQELRRAIVEPNAEITEGFQPGIMPPNYEQTLTDEELDALITYLEEAAGS